MPDAGAAEYPEFPDAVLTELTRDPRPAVSRAALAAQFPSWGAATLSLLAIGLVVGFASLRPLGMAIDACAAHPGLVVCRPKMHAVVVALPVGALIVGLAVSLIGGRQVVRLGRPPLLAAWVGWAVFGVGTLTAYLLAGVL